MKIKRRSLKNFLALSFALTVGPCLIATEASAATCADKKWTEGEQYRIGNVVRYNNHNYAAAETHMPVVGAQWTPARYPRLWRDMGVCANAAKPVAAQSAPQPQFSAALPGSFGEPSNNSFASTNSSANNPSSSDVYVNGEFVNRKYSVGGGAYKGGSSASRARRSSNSQGGYFLR